MKTIYTALFILLAATAYSQSVLSISASGNETYQVTINGRNYNMNQNGLLLRDLRQGNYTIRITRQSNGRQHGRQWGQRGQVVYASSIYLRNATHTDIMINRFGNAFVDERTVNGRYDDWYDDDRGGGYNNYRRAMSNDDFQRLLSNMKEQRFSDGKMTVARDALNRNLVSTSQLILLLQQFSFESDKLELAKHGYRSITDRNNFYLVYSEFRFGSNREELERYVQMTQ